MQPFPEWVIFHVPHDSKIIPAEVRHQFALDDVALMQEIIKMTDHHTLELFTRGVPEQQIIRSPVSGLVVDVERFVDDAMEPMATRGMRRICSACMCMRWYYVRMNPRGRSKPLPQLIKRPSHKALPLELCLVSYKT